MAIPTYRTAKVHLTLLSPVHIGCGETYDPSCYVIGDDDVLYAFEPTLVALPSAKQNDLRRLANTGTALDWAVFFYDNREYFIPASRAVMKAGRAVLRTYRTLVQQKKQQNQCFIERTAYASSGEDDVAYIPGSSVKGAVHTALADRINDGRQAVYKGVGKMLDIDKAIIGGSFSSSPMRFVKVGDFMPVGHAAQKAVLARRLYKGDADAVKKSIPAAYETLWPGIYRNFVSTWSIQAPQLSDAVPNCYESFAAIARDLNRKTLRLLNAECAYLEHFRESQAWVVQIRKVVGALLDKLEAGSVALVRLGKNQGAQSLVLDGSPSPKANPRTQFFVNDDGVVLPFGWALLEFEEQETAAVKAWCSQQEQPLRVDLEAIRRSRLEMQARLRAEREAKEAQRRSEEAAEAQQAARLAAMTPQERQLEIMLGKLSAFRGDVKPGTELFQAVLNLLNEALTWPVDMQRQCAQKMGPIIKSKGMYQGKAEKELKARLRVLRNEGS